MNPSLGNLPALLRNDYVCMKLEDETMFIWIDAVWAGHSGRERVDGFLTAPRKRLSQLGNGVELQG